MQRKVIYSSQQEVQKLEDFKHADLDKQRFLVYAHMLNPTDRVIKYETDEKLCYFKETLTPKFGTKGYIQRLTTDGFTYDKKTKKLSVWYGKKLIKISQILINSMMTDIGAGWYHGMGLALKMVATRMLFEKIFKGSIQSPAHYCESYVKYHLKIKELEWLAYYSEVAGNNSTSIGELNVKLRYAVDPNDLIKNHIGYTANQHVSPGHVITNCQILGTKFDWSMSGQAQIARLAEMDKEVEKLQKEYKLVKEFYDYAYSVKEVDKKRFTILK